MDELDPDNAINPNDVLLGRGGNTFRHVGNRKFREQARVLAHRYSQSTKLEKSQLSRSLMQSVKQLNPPGRFLKKEKDFWVEVDEYVAREKASQCLRDAVSLFNKVEEVVGVLPSSSTEKSPDIKTSPSAKGNKTILSKISIEDQSPMESKSANARNESRKNIGDTKPAVSKSQGVQDLLSRGQQMDYQMHPRQIDYTGTPYQDLRGKAFQPIQPTFQSTYQPRHGGDDQEINSEHQGHPRAAYFPHDPTPIYQEHATAMRPAHAGLHDNIQMTPIRPTESNSNRIHYHNFPHLNDFPSTLEDDDFEASKKQLKTSTSSPENLHLGNFYFPGVQETKKKSPSKSPDKKRRKQQQRSSEDFDLFCRSTSHSVDSLDSFAKSL